MYPFNKETANSLFTVSNNASSALTADITSVATEAVVIDSSKFPSGRFILSIESELIIVSSKDDSLNTLYFEQRGAFGTTAAPHSTATRVNCNITAQHYETLRDNLINTQNYTWTYRAPVEAITSVIPSTPSVGLYYIVAEGATGAWLGLDNNIVSWNGSAWVSITPDLGFQIYDKETENLYKFTSRGWEPGATANTPTEVKTSNYLARNGELVRCSTISGSFIVTLPDAPEDGDVVAILDVSNWFSQNNLIVAQGNPTQNIQGTLDDLALNISGTYIELFWNASTNDWRLLETPTYVPVTSVFGRIGNVLAQAGDYTAQQVNFTPTPRISSTNVQDAITEVESLIKSNLDGGHPTSIYGGTLPIDGGTV